MDSKTPSNPLGLEKGHKIPHGEHTLLLCVPGALQLCCIGPTLLHELAAVMGPIREVPCSTYVWCVACGIVKCILKECYVPVQRVCTGEALNIYDILKRTNNGCLHRLVSQQSDN